MRKRERITQAVAVCLFTLVAVSAAAQTSDLTIVPNHFFVFDVENFLIVRGAQLGTASTVVTYTLGETVFSVAPQIDPDHPSLSDVWVPIGVASQSGSWSVRVVATDTDGAQRV